MITQHQSRFILFAMICMTIISSAAGAIQTSVAPSPADFKVSFIPKPWEVNVERKYIMLDEGWIFFKGQARKISDIDTAVTGITDPKHYRLRDGSTAPIGDKCDKPQSDACDDSSWITMNAPFNWFDLGKEMDDFNGTAWYRKEFEAPAAVRSGKALLHFRGVYYRAWVYLNGERVGFHEGGYTPFFFDVTRILKPGLNLLAVRVNNEIGPEDIRIGDWWNFGGIHREAFVELTDETYIKDISIKTDPARDMSSADVRFTLDVSGDGADTAVVLIYRLGGDEKELVGTATAGLNGAGKTTLTWRADNPALWSPETPNLYFAKAALYGGGKQLDGLGDMFGVRKFEVRGLKLFLNNKEVFFRGVNRHDEFYHGEFPDSGRVMSEQDRINDFKAIKEMNCNSMRTAHYPNHPYNYYITDRLGIMTIEEGGPIGGMLDDDAHIEKIKNQLREMVERDKNHPSIVIWSIGNEFGGDKYLKYIRESAAYMRTIDDRALTFTETGGREVKKGYQYVDILSRNQYTGWYGAGIKPVETPNNLKNLIRIGLTGLLQQYHGEYPDKPIFIMEFGAESICGQHAADPENFVARGDEEYQEIVYIHSYRVMLDHKYVVGTFPWILADFKTKSAGGTCQFTPHLNRKGLLCTDRTKKRTFFLVQKIYEDISKRF